MVYDTANKWNKEILFKFLTQEEIFEYYLGIPVQYDYLVKNPLRNDRNPTCNFSWWGDKLYFRDWAGKSYDCINIVQLLPGCKHYYDACRRIAEDLGLTESKDRKPVQIVYQEKEKTLFEVTKRDWSNWDYSFWKRFGISDEILHFYNVSPIKAAWINKTPLLINSRERIFAYRIKPYHYKLYFVDRNKGNMRFLQNCGKVMQGFSQLPEWSTEIVITKSYKDVMAARELGLSAVCMINESAIPTERQMQLLYPKCSRLFSLMDLDSTGIHTAKEIKRLYDVPPLFFPSRFKHFNATIHDQIGECYKKDLSDNIEQFGKEHMKRIITLTKQLVT